MGGTFGDEGGGGGRGEGLNKLGAVEGGDVGVAAVLGGVPDLPARLTENRKRFCTNARTDPEIGLLCYVAENESQND